MSLPALYDYQINDVFNMCKNYGGCISRLSLKQSDAKKHKFYILNMDANPNGFGTHWVILWNCNKKYVFYCDSFGAPPAENVVKFMKETGKECLYNDMMLQDMNSSSCGWFCVYILLKLLNHENPADILLRDFTINPNQNEQRLKNYFASL
jgi:hypothetical protein